MKIGFFVLVSSLYNLREWFRKIWNTTLNRSRCCSTICTTGGNKNPFKCCNRG